ncbi:TetR/AcrR family transcriptional regulator [Mycobacterium sp. SMC-11]|uniref:TetR/AcrR family transcriptional regulator n=1 Tax=Mycobacterium sp. SMC-11 TaxID=3385969 RepID=UPI00390C57EB
MSLTSSPRGRPAGTNSEETRQRIITAAIRRVAEVGRAGATIRDIASAAEMTSASLYHYFPNKDELMAATVAAAREIALPRLHGAAQRGGTVADRLAAVLAEADRLSHDHPYLAAFERAAGEASPLRDVIGEVVDEARRGGSLATGIDSDGAADAVYALTRGLTEQAAQLSPDAYRATLRCAEDLLRGTLF